MRNMKRWIAAMLTIALTIGDCGIFPAYAAENTMAVEASVSQNAAESSGL